MRLIFTALLARHGIRSVYPPFGESQCNTYTKYTGREFPTFADWGMTEEEFCEQALTPHGKLVAPRVGEYYRSVFDDAASNETSFSQITDFEFGCDTLAVFSDNSTRNIQTSELFIDGFGCAGQTEVQIAGKDALTETVYPVVYDHYNNLQCPTADQKFVEGLFGGDPNFITDSFLDRIGMVDDFLQMSSYNASICTEANPDFDVDVDGPCNLFKTGYQYTGLYFQGMATAPYNRAGYFAEAWMLQYVSNLPNWGFGEMTIEELEYMFALHAQNQIFGGNNLNSLAYYSQGIGYILASMEQAILDEPVAGIDQGPEKNILVLEGHDFNLGYAFDILNLEYVFDDAKAQHSVLYTTTGQLRFDLLESDDDDGSYFVKTTFTVASPTQQRNNDPLTVETPPEIRILASPLWDMQVLCPYEKFKDIVLNQIKLDCVEEPLRGSLKAMDGGDKTTSGGSSLPSCGAVCSLLITLFAIVLSQ